MSTETVRTIRDREPRTATSNFTQLLNSGIMNLALYLYFVLDYPKTNKQTTTNNNNNKTSTSQPKVIVHSTS